MDNSQLQINIPYCQQQTNGVDCGIYPVQMHFKFQVELACQTLKLIKIDESALFFSIYSRMVLKCLPKKQRNTVTLSSLEAISTAGIFCISKMWWLWYHIKNPDLSMADCENIPGDVINKFKGSMALFRLQTSTHCLIIFFPIWVFFHENSRFIWQHGKWKLSL